MIVAFDDIEIDLDAFEIRRAGEPVRIEPQVFDVVRLLVERHGDLVTKEELLDTVWGTPVRRRVQPDVEDQGRPPSPG